MSLVQVPAQARILDNFLAGKATPPVGNIYQEVTSPYTGKVVGRVALSDARDVAVAVAAAKSAFDAWRVVPIKERSLVLHRFRELVLANLEELANTAALEAGKTVEEARAGILKGIEVTDYALSLQNHDQGGKLEVSRGVTCEV